METIALTWETTLILYVGNFGVDVASQFQMAGKRTRWQWRDFAFFGKHRRCATRFLGVMTRPESLRASGGAIGREMISIIRTTHPMLSVGNFWLGVGRDFTWMASRSDGRNAISLIRKTPSTYDALIWRIMTRSKFTWPENGLLTGKRFRLFGSAVGAWSW